MRAVKWWSKTSAPNFCHDLVSRASLYFSHPCNIMFDIRRVLSALTRGFSFCISLPVTNLIKHLAPPSRYIICVKLQPNSNAISITSVTGAFGVVCARTQRNKSLAQSTRRPTIGRWHSKRQRLCRRRHWSRAGGVQRPFTGGGQNADIYFSCLSKLQTLIICVHKTSRSADWQQLDRPGSSLCREAARRIIFFRLMHYLKLYSSCLCVGGWGRSAAH